MTKGADIYDFNSPSSSEEDYIVEYDDLYSDLTIDDDEEFTAETPSPVNPISQHPIILNPGPEYSSAAVGGSRYAAAAGGSRYAAAAGGSSRYPAASGGGSTYAAASGGGSTCAAAAGGSSRYPAAAGGSSTYAAASGGGSTYAAASGGGSTYAAASGGGSTYAAASGGGSGFASAAEGGSGFASAAEGGSGFASAAEGGSGFASAAEGGSGFASAAEGGSGFASATEGGSGFASAVEGGSGYSSAPRLPGLDIAGSRFDPLVCAPGRGPLGSRILPAGSGLELPTAREPNFDGKSQYTSTAAGYAASCPGPSTSGYVAASHGNPVHVSVKVRPTGNENTSDSSSQSNAQNFKAESWLVVDSDYKTVKETWILFNDPQSGPCRDDSYKAAAASLGCSLQERESNEATADSSEIPLTTASSNGVTCSSCDFDGVSYDLSHSSGGEFPIPYIRPIYEFLEFERAKMLQRESFDEVAIKRWMDLLAERDLIFRTAYCEETREQQLRSVEKFEKICNSMQKQIVCPDYTMAFFKDMINRVMGISKLVKLHLKNANHGINFATYPHFITELGKLPTVDLDADPFRLSGRRFMYEPSSSSQSEFSATGTEEPKSSTSCKASAAKGSAQENRTRLRRSAAAANYQRRRFAEPTRDSSISSSNSPPKRRFAAGAERAVPERNNLQRQLAEPREKSSSESSTASCEKTLQNSLGPPEHTHYDHTPIDTLSSAPIPPSLVRRTRFAEPLPPVPFSIPDIRSVPPVPFSIPDIRSIPPVPFSIPDIHSVDGSPTHEVDPLRRLRLSEHLPAVETQSLPVSTKKSAGARSERGRGPSGSSDGYESSLMFEFADAEELGLRSSEKKKSGSSGVQKSKTKTAQREILFDDTPPSSGCGSGLHARPFSPITHRVHEGAKHSIPLSRRIDPTSDRVTEGTSGSASLARPIDPSPGGVTEDTSGSAPLARPIDPSPGRLTEDTSGSSSIRFDDPSPAVSTLALYGSAQTSSQDGMTEEDNSSAPLVRLINSMAGRLTEDTTRSTSPPKPTNNDKEL